MEWLLSNLLLDEAEYGLKNYSDPRGHHFVFTKHVRFSTIFSSTSKTDELMQTLPQGLGFLVTLCIIDVILLDIPNLFQIWSTLVGFEELAMGFEPIIKRRNILTEK